MDYVNSLQILILVILKVYCIREIKHFLLKTPLFTTVDVHYYKLNVVFFF